MPKGVKCLVQECIHNHQNDCVAEAIEVHANGNNIVGTEKGTLCATFKFLNFDDHGRMDSHVHVH
ncbi:MAG: hypothetical protein A2201_06215 [Alicyclobacillus sp. RIFOXYA1_FULL_53_8]|nr:MAG: hypothetical protein A2201_06215 [Alicyclobacillus sp. RIFOXYA1_FULL_53_8]